VINAIKFSIEEIEASDQYFDHTRYPSSGGSIARFYFICQRTKFPTGTGVGR